MESGHCRAYTEQVKVIVQILALGVSLALASCSNENGRADRGVWVPASSLGPTNVPYMPKPIIALVRQIRYVGLAPAKGCP